MKIQKNDFIEIDFTGKTSEGDVFDSTMKEDLEKVHSGHNHEIKAEPLTFCVGQGMFLNSLDEFLIDKEVGKSYDVELTPEKSFGPRKRDLINTIPMRVFKEKNINPVQGFTLNFDGKAGKILAASGGRVMVDFNHPLAGKNVNYKIKVIKKIDKVEDKIDSLNRFFFGKPLKKEIKDKKLTLYVEKPMMRLAELFKEKYKEILELDLDIKEDKLEEKINKN